MSSKRFLACLSLVFLAVPVLADAETSPPANNVDLLWQGETYTPPFYLGRALWTNQSRITLVAIPHIPSGGGEMNPSTLIYKWSQDGAALGSASGKGKQALAWNDSVLSLPTKVSVDVTLPDGTIVGSALVNLAPVSAQTLVVESNPLYGLMLNQAIKDAFDLNGQEVSFVALPLYADISNRASGAETYSWMTNGTDLRAGNKVTYRIPEGSTGSSQVLLKVQNKNTLTQPENKSFLVQFGGQTSL